MKGAYRRLGILLALALCLGACSSVSEPASGTDHVRAVVLPYLSQAPLHIAASEGYFEQYGLDVEFVRLGRNQDIMSSLARGNVDVAVGMISVNELALMAAGARIRAVAGLGVLDPDHCTHAAFVARTEHLESGALQDPERLRRLRIDANVVLPLGYWLDTLVDPLGLTIDDLELADLPSPAAISALADGTIDITADAEPWIGIHTAGDQASIWKPVGKLFPGWLLSAVMYGPTILDQRRPVGERFATAVLEGIRQYNLGKTPDNRAIVERATGLSPDRVASACWVKIRGDARIDPSVFSGYQEWAVARGLLDRVLSPEELVDPHFIDHANVELSSRS